MKNLSFSFLVAGLLFSSCRVAQMAVEPALEKQAQELTISGRKTFNPNSSFDLGTYRVADVKRGWTRTTGFGLFVYENIKAAQQFQFTTRPAAGEPWFIYAATGLKQNSLNFRKGLSISLSPDQEYFASYFTSTESGPWHLLTVDPGHYLARNRFVGELSNGKTTITIKPVYHFEGHKMPATEILGYTFWEAEIPLAGVQVLNGGKAWLKPELPDDIRQVLVSAMASLLLYEKFSLLPQPAASE